MALWLGISELESGKTTTNWRLMLKEWSNKTGEKLKRILFCRLSSRFLHMIFHLDFYITSYLSIIVNNFVSVNVVLLPELGFVCVQEAVSPVLEHDALHPEAGVPQPALV